MEPEVIQAEMVLPTYLSFKRIQMYEKYPKGQSRGRHWKHLKQIIQAENYQNYLPDEPNYVNIESLPSMHPCKKICDITGFEAPYYDPRTNLRFASADVFKQVRSLPNDYVQRYLALRNAAVVLKWLSNFDYFGNFLLLLLVFTLFNIHLRLTCILPSAFCHSFETLQFSLCVSFMSLFHTASQTS